MAMLPCPHCKHANFDISAYCARCQRPLRVPMPLLEPASDKTQVDWGDRSKTVVMDLQSLLRQRDSSTKSATPPPAPSSSGDDPKTDKINLPEPREHVFNEVTQVVRVTSPSPPAPALAKPLPLQEQPTVLETSPLPMASRPPAASAPAPVKPFAHARLTAEPLPRESFEPTTPPQATTGAVAAPVSLWRLLSALLIDLLLCSTLVWISLLGHIALSSKALPAAALSWDSLDWPQFAEWLHVYPQLALRGVGLGLLLSLLYGSVGGRYGATLGRRLLGLRLVDQHGTSLSWQRALPRALLGSVSFCMAGAGFFYMLIDSRQRGWHDLLTRTQVIWVRRA